MIVTASDLREVDAMLERHKLYYSDPERLPAPGEQVFFANRPHLLMPLGYDEFQSIGKEGDRSIDNFGLSRFSVDFECESVYRDRKQGAWYWFEAIGEDSLHFIGPGEYTGNMECDRNIPIAEWRSLLETVNRGSKDPTPRALWLPGVWTPSAQDRTREILGRSVPLLLRAIYEEEEELAAISPRRLEEIIAELLRARGLQIHITPETRDGGRDVIARGELIPGEPIVMAVEVKQKAVVGLHDVQRSLYANQDLPALMLATSGRFSAGVIKERDREQNRLRLILKDGIALSQWIDLYARLNAWPKHTT